MQAPGSTLGHSGELPPPERYNPPCDQARNVGRRRPGTSIEVQPLPGKNAQKLEG
jgi:hypothetical protein